MTAEPSTLVEFLAGQSCARREMAAVPEHATTEPVPHAPWLPGSPNTWQPARRIDVTDIPSRLANQLTAQGQRITGCGGVPFAGHDVVSRPTDTTRTDGSEYVVDALAADAHPLVDAKRDLETAHALVRRARELIASVMPNDVNDPRHRVKGAGLDARSAQLLLDDAIERLHNLGVA
ncbi:hypothetical protein LGT39_05935 [Demequina sp. TTPB684]|uniref:hypothetical protein n=1 Tax=unclassified Demequina TaxID=2620311 RepID=UPI001CF22499|nr:MULTISPECIES: hypothetical protein [unclassified Demequina]MCB2412388.1 hypothetical protein [Demequina sp. TTPB684]UPU89058.1 hypothetical protein LGT36_003790 [Demequina sp. TMPB413]